MTSDDAAIHVIDVLEHLSIPYMVVGSLSVNCYAVPRSTIDADFVVQLEGRSIGEIAQALGSDFSLDPQMGFETITGTSRYLFHVRSTRFKVEVFLLSDDLHDIERFKRRRRIEVVGRTAFVPTAEDVVIMKIRWSKGGSRQKDVEDVRAVLRMMAGSLDWPYVLEWCERHGTRSLIEQIREEVGAE